ncbi:MAG: alpha-mannosidase [Firmicutes bacterium]|nr:alpha-mannosidase [Bacillota bacterium]
MKDKSCYYLVGNAHLDPIWQWQWQEGSAEAKATLRSALDRMKEFPEFRFVCSSASVYQWVEEFAPDMFEEIKQRVQEGRFIIVGGWHVQPDCNSPSGEGFARQALYSQRYFQEKFGVTAKVGYDVDSFGHNGMLPQILRQSGMESYIMMRPSPVEKTMESDVFRWTSPDGSQVLTYRILDPYCFNFNSLEDLKKRMAYLDQTTATDLDILPFFYGVGNHGGGPTIRNLEVLREYQAKHPEKTLIYSDLSDFFAQADQQDIPEYHDDLQHHAAGCYATVNHVKNGIRRGEVELAAAENYAFAASKLCGKKVKNERFEEAWKNILFLHFHDSMGGCCIKEGHEDSKYMYGAAMNAAAVEENNALQTLSWAISMEDTSKGLPVVVFNPHAFAVKEMIKVNKQCGVVRDHEGNVVESQFVRSSTEECYWRYDTLFEAKVPALGYSVYYLDEIKGDLQAVNIPGSVTARMPEGFCTANNHEGAVLENEIYRIEFELHTGYIVSFVDKRTGQEIICDRAAVPTVIDEYYHDTWSHAKNFFTDVMARFADAKVSVMENGPIRATVKVVSKYNLSTITQYFSLEAGCDQLKVRASVDWHEQHKMLKMAWPMKVENPKAYYEIPFGVIERPADGEEEPGLMWTAVKGTNGGFAVVNDRTYSSSVKGSTIYHTILRSPIYGDHGGPRTEESEFTEQGVMDFNYIIMGVKDSWAPVVQTAKLLNKPTTHIIETWHKGKIDALCYSGLQLNQPNVMMSALKRSEDGRGDVIRLYETDGRKTDVTASGDLLRVPLKVTVTPYSVRTYYLADDSENWQEVLFAEMS